MLDWHRITETLFQARTELFTYSIEPVDGQFHWNLMICGHCVAEDGPFSLHDAKESAQADYRARIDHALEVM